MTDDDRDYPQPPTTSDASTPYPAPARLETGAANAAMDRVGSWVVRLGEWLVRGRR
jgi:hypothetical protein